MNDDVSNPIGGSDAMLTRGRDSVPRTSPSTRYSIGSPDFFYGEFTKTPIRNAHF
jgi:hypothetical protein